MPCCLHQTHLWTYILAYKVFLAQLQCQQTEQVAYHYCFRIDIACGVYKGSQICSMPCCLHYDVLKKLYKPKQLSTCCSDALNMAPTNFAVMLRTALFTDLFVDSCRALQGGLYHSEYRFPQRWVDENVICRKHSVAHNDYSRLTTNIRLYYT